MHSNDAELVSRCLAGDTDAFGELVERYQGAVHAVGYHYAGRYGSAEDVAQEAFIAAYRSLPQLKDPNHFGPWLREVACRTAANWLRRHGYRIQNETPLPFRRSASIEDAHVGPWGEMEQGERFDRVQQAIDALPERYRLPVVLRYLQEMSYQEIADFIGISRDEVRGVLQRAGRQLRDFLAELDRSSEGESGWRNAGE
jgi:RNA polymerase sigma-70 factor (ECF subfamily)